MVTITELKTYIDNEIKNMNNYIDHNPYCTKPIDTINSTESRCFGAVDFCNKMGCDFTEIDAMWWKYLCYFRDRRNEVRKCIIEKKT